nr:hypothetical protein Itr_chr14CG11100 [Ipomoea trifida]
MEFTNPIKKSNRKSVRTSLLTELFLWDRQRLPLLLSNYYNEEQREVYRVEQPPERGVNDTAREWVSARSGRISVVNRASHCLVVDAVAFAGVVCHLMAIDTVGVCRR